MSKPTTPRLPFDEAAPVEPAPPGGPVVMAAVDAADRAAAVDPRLNVVLEASAGTGKTSVLVNRYTNLIRAGVDPRNILAITFTRKAAAEMRERILAGLVRAAEQGGIDETRWRSLSAHLGEIAISTIDAFCLSLLREFPLEADLDPGFGMADETEAARLVEESLDKSMRISRALAAEDAAVGLVLGSLGDLQVRRGLSALLDRRLVAGNALTRAMRGVPDDLTAAGAAQRLLERVRESFSYSDGGLSGFVRTGPVRSPRFKLLTADLTRMTGDAPVSDDTAFREVRRLVDGLRTHFFTREHTPRKKTQYPRNVFISEDARKRHQALLERLAPSLAEDINAFRRDLNAVLTRGVWRLFHIALAQYRGTLASHAVVDFPDALQRTLELLGEMDEFTQSRFQLESRFHHLLVDEFQDTSDAQWRLVWQLVQSWREGLGIAQDLPLEPTIFVVGDRKQSIYGFRDADVGVLRRASSRIAELRADGQPVRRAIRHSFRAVPALQSFTNALCDEIDKAPERPDAFAYEDSDRFPVDAGFGGEPALGVIATTDLASAATAVAGEVARLLASGVVRDRQTGARRPARPGDIAILFRSRDGHQAFETALGAVGVPSYVYKGLGFFDTDEVKDIVALLRLLADPSSDLRAAAFLRSRIARISDRALSALAPGLAAALVASRGDEHALTPDDRAVLARVRASVPRWVALADRVPPAELLDRVLDECAYDFLLAGPRAVQARENLKKVRAILRRIQNRGYTTMARVAEHLDRLSAGDESGAVIDAANAVNLMTIHAAKGLEFPIVFLVNLGRGAGGGRDPIRIAGTTEDEVPSVAIGDFRSEADEDANAREREEAKRLLYVAVTRARDRLYLGSVVGEDGAFLAARGGLGDVLPVGVRQVFQDSRVPGVDVVEWRALGSTHRFAVCRPPDAAGQVPVVSGTMSEPSAADADFGELGPAGDAPSATMAAPSVGHVRAPRGRSRSEARLVGTLVHRLIERWGLSSSSLTNLERGLAPTDRQFLGTSWQFLHDSTSDAASVALELYEMLAGRDDLRALFDGAEAWHEVPIVMRGGGVRRGTIDTVLRARDGRITVLEFKTGGPDPDHQSQLDRYVQAVGALFPGTVVQGRVEYVGMPEKTGEKSD